MIEKYRFLYLLALLALAGSQLTNSHGYCMGDCANCDLYALARCRGESPCHQGYHAPNNTDLCQLSPSLQLISKELGEREIPSQVPFISGWGHTAKTTKCSYPSLASQQIIDVLGFFSQTASMEKQYSMPQNTQNAEFSFSLIRNDWMPFSDFLMIELSIDGKSLQIFEISFDKRHDIKEQQLQLSCEGTPMFIENYRIKVKDVKGKKLKVGFNSFLFDGIWAITNIKLITGCVGFSSVDANGDCTQCSEGTYFSQITPTIGECVTCPSLCKTCQKDKCLRCRWGQLIEGQCQPPPSFKSQSIELAPLSVCNKLSMKLNPPSQPLGLPVLSNHQKQLYDQVIVSTTVYYDLQSLPGSGTPELTLLVNGQALSSFKVEPSPVYSEHCHLFASDRVSQFTLLTAPFQINDNSVKIELDFKGVSRFGVTSATVYSIKKGVTPGSAQSQQQPQYSDIATGQASSQGQQPHTSGLTIIQSQGNMKLSNQNASSRQVPNGQIRFDSNNPDLSTNTAFSTTSSGHLQVSIKNVPAIQGQLLIEIRPISPNDYNLINSYYQDNDLVLLINISRGFKDGEVVVKEVYVPRLLQQTGQTQVVGRVAVPRFDSYGSTELETISAMGTVFSVVAWATIVAMFLAVMSGYGIIVEEHLITMQLLYLHVYIGYDLLPLPFRDVVSQLRTVGFLHFIPEKMVTADWALQPQAMYWLSPQYFNFFHALLPIFLSLLIYATWFFILLAVKKWCLPQKVPDSARSTVHKLADNIVCRTINFADSIWRYQFISVLLICTMQFVASQQTQTQTPAVSVAIVVLILTAVWLTVSEIHIRNQYYENEYSQFVYLFEDRYYGKIPLHSLPSRHHRLGYPVMRIAKCFLFVLAVMLIDIPIVAISGLIFINGFELCYLLQNSIFSDQKLFKLKIAETSLLLILQVFMLTIRFLYQSATTASYTAWGYILSTTVLATLTLTLVRSAIVLAQKHLQSKGINFQQVDIDQRKLQTQRAV